VYKLWQNTKVWIPAEALGCVSLAYPYKTGVLADDVIGGAAVLEETSDEDGPVVAGEEPLLTLLFTAAVSVDDEFRSGLLDPPPIPTPS